MIDRAITFLSCTLFALFFGCSVDNASINPSANTNTSEFDDQNYSVFQLVDYGLDHGWGVGHISGRLYVKNGEKYAFDALGQVKPGGGTVSSDEGINYLFSITELNELAGCLAKEGEEKADITYDQARSIPVDIYYKIMDKNGLLQIKTSDYRVEKFE